MNDALLSCMSVAPASHSWPGSALFASHTSLCEHPRACAHRGWAPQAKPGDDAQQTLLLGRVLGGKYRLDRLLGTGAMGSVFAATHVRNANRVAIKILHPALTANVDVRGRFLREGYAANSVGHAGTVRALDDGTTEDGAAFFVMELLEGETLDALWERRGRHLGPFEVAQLMSQLLAILEAAHANGIVHRDIKPENLFLEHDGTLRVLDFGVARILDGTLTETRAGSVIGTLPYMAPEQTLGRSRQVDAQSDIWSVGATAFTLVSGRFVHDAETPEEMMVFTGSRQPRSLGEVATDVPPEFMRVIDRALRFDKRERWPSALSMRMAFAEVCGSESRRPEESLEGAALQRIRPVRSSDAGSDLLEVGRLCSSTLLSKGEPAVRPRWVRAHRWATGAAIALVVGGAVESRSAHHRTPAQPMAPASLTAPLAGPLGPLAMDIAPAPYATAAVPLVPMATPVVLTAEVRAAAVATSAVEHEHEPALDTATGIASKLAAPVKSSAALPRAARSEGAAAPAESDGCSPPFMILPVTGKKLWKRECL